MQYISECPSIDFDGHPRILAALPPVDFGNLPKFRTALLTEYKAQPLPRSEWVEFDFTDSKIPILDQNGYGSCTGHGICTAFTKAWVRGGQKYKAFSPVWTYGLTNGGVDKGAVISDGVRVLQSQGICLASQVPEGDIYASNYPKKAYTSALNYKLQDAYHLETPDDVGTAIQLGFDVVFGMTVGDNFADLDAEGFAPPVPRGRIGGHCMCDGEGMKESTQWGWGIKVRNSWGTRFGLNGFVYVSIDHSLTCYNQGLDAYAIRSDRVAPENVADVPSYA